MNWKRTLIACLLALFGFTLAFGTGYFTHAALHPAGTQFGVFNEALRLFEQNAIDNLPESPILEYGMIHGLLQAYGDPYTRFFEPVQSELSNDNLAGSYGGIGATLERDTIGFALLYPFPDGPAAQAGVRDGDRLMAIDELDILPEMTTDEIVAVLRGPEGAAVRLEIARPPTWEKHAFEIERASIPLPSVTWRLDADETRLGIIKVNLIAASTPAEIEKAAQDLMTQGAQFFALDLRGNGGGLVDAGVNIAALFLEQGDILQEQYRDKPVETYSVTQVGPYINLPLVVLVDNNTASAAEIIAGALQVHQRAVLIGTPTHGKDSIQLAFDLQDGSSLHVTAAKWWIPGLDTIIGENGLQPNLFVEPNENLTDAALTAAIDYFTQNESLTP